MFPRLVRPICRRVSDGAAAFSSSNASVPPEVAALQAQVTALEARLQQLEATLAKSSATAMRYRALGRTGARVSTLSLGCAGLGGVYGALDQAQADATVLAALRHGVNLFDTSPYYGDTVSEAVLGTALRHAVEGGEFARDDFYIATKVGRYGAGEGADFSRARVAASIGQSMERLQTDRIDLIQCHDMEFAASLDQVVHEALPAMEEARGQGKVAHVGITGLPLAVIDYVVNAYDGGPIDSILSYCCYTLNNTGLTEYLPRWRHAGIGVIQGGATSMGLLTPGGPQEWHPAPAEVRAACREAVELCDRLGEDVVKLAFQYTFAQPDVATVLIGAITPEAVEQNVRWCGQPLNEELAEEVQSVLAPIRNRLWVETGSEENIALASSGFWAKGHGTTKVIEGGSKNLSC